MGRGGRILLRRVLSPTGVLSRLKVHSMVGLLPLCATTVVEPWQRDRVPRCGANHVQDALAAYRTAREHSSTGPGHYGYGGRGIVALLNEDRLRRSSWTRMLDENEFLSPYGIRALSTITMSIPLSSMWKARNTGWSTFPPESDTGMFGGNSNWRGPIWMPVNALILRALMSFYLYYGDNNKIECPTGSGKLMNLFEVARAIANRLTAIFVRDKSGRRPVYGGTEKFQTDPQWKDYILFFEYFHGDNGADAGSDPSDGMDRPGRENDRDLRPRRRTAVPGSRQIRRFCQWARRGVRDYSKLTIIV